MEGEDQYYNYNSSGRNSDIKNQVNSFTDNLLMNPIKLIKF